MKIYDNKNKEINLVDIEKLEVCQAFDLVEKGKLGFCLVAWVEGRKYPAVISVLGDEQADKDYGKRGLLPYFAQIVALAKAWDKKKHAKDDFPGLVDDMFDAAMNDPDKILYGSENGIKEMPSMGKLLNTMKE